MGSTSTPSIRTSRAWAFTRPIIASNSRAASSGAMLSATPPASVL